MSRSAIVIIGASKGIGKALTLTLAHTYPNNLLIAVSRHISSLQNEFASKFSNI